MKEKIKLLIKNAAIMITIFVFVVLILAAFETAGFKRELDDDFWNGLLMNMFLQLLMIGVWVPEGKKQGAAEKIFLDNKIVLEGKIASASKPENYKDLEEWCKVATERNREMIIKNKLRKVGILYHIYLEKKDDVGWRVVQTPRAQKLMKWLDENIVYVKEIKATELISNSPIKLVYDIANKETLVTGLKIGAKVFISFMMSVITASIMFTRKEFTLDALAELGFWIITILSTIYFSKRTGKELVTIVRQDFIIRNITFLDNCDSWLMGQGKSPIAQIK